MVDAEAEKKLIELEIEMNRRFLALYSDEVVAARRAINKATEDEVRAENMREATQAQIDKLLALLNA